MKETFISPSRKQQSYQRILVLGTDPDECAIIAQPLNWEGYDVKAVHSVNEAKLLVGGWVPHVVLLDWSDSFRSGVQALKNLKSRLQHTSFMFLSAEDSTEAIIEVLDSGADDFIVKPFVPLELLARIRSQMRIRDLHEQLLVVNGQLQELVDIDDLTGLFNMRSLYQKLDFELERSKRFSRDVTVVMMDMDHFKSVNDGHDHLFGSYVISEVGKIIKSCTRNVDIPARYGGDEFLMVLTETDHEGAVIFCERLRHAIQSREFTSGQDSMYLTTSIGFATTIPGERITSKELVRRADHSLYDAKRSGRNKVCYYQPSNQIIALPMARNKKKLAG